MWIWVFKSWLDVEWSLEASVELVAAHPHPLQEAAGNERPWAWVWLVQRCGSPGGSTCPDWDTRSSDAHHGPHPRERPGASAVLGTSSCQGVAAAAQGTRPSAPSPRTNIRSTRSAHSFQLRALIPESAGRGPGLCASQVPQLILISRHTRETTRGGQGQVQSRQNPAGPGTFPERTAPHIQNAGRGCHC